MPTEEFSFSKLKTFDQCKFQYAQRYIIREWPGGGGIEAFVGSRVHQVAEAIQKGECPAKLAQAWQMFDAVWEAKYAPERYFDVRRRGEAWWHDHGRRCLRHFLSTGLVEPGWEVLGLEYNMRLGLLDDPPAKLRGILDRLVRCIDTGQYEVHDFKTGRKPERRWFERDHQLPLYAQLVRGAYGLPPEIAITCKRYYLATGDVESYIVTGARSMEAWNWAMATAQMARDFVAEYAESHQARPEESPLCDWCSLKRTICPVFNQEETHADDF
jgi:hypothetical protein